MDSKTLGLPQRSTARLGRDFGASDFGEYDFGEYDYGPETACMVVSIASKRIVTVEKAKPASDAMNVHCECMDSRIRMLPVLKSNGMIVRSRMKFGDLIVREIQSLLFMRIDS